MVYGFSLFAGNSGGGGFPGGSVRPGLPLGEVNFDFDWVFDVVVKILSSLGSIFDLMFSPMYTWFDYVLSFIGFSEGYINVVIKNLSKMEFFQMNFFEFLFALLPVVIAISLLVWILRLIGSPLTGPL